MLALAPTVDLSRFSAFAGSFGRFLAAPLADASMRRGVEGTVGAYAAEQQQRFRSASGGDGTWPDLAPSTKLARLRKMGWRYKREKGVTHADRLRQAAAVKLPILIETEALITSLRPGAPGNVLIVGPDRVTYGTAVFYGRFHQEGGSVPGRPPQRRFLWPPSEAVLAKARDQFLYPAAARVSQTLVSQALAA